MFERTSMDIRFIESFLTVVECGSMAEASRRLNLTPAAIAARVKALEAYFGVKLVQRSGRNVKPTKAGLLVSVRAQNVLRELRDMRAFATDDSALGELRLGVSSSLLTGTLPRVLKHYYETYPKLTVFLDSGTSSDLYHKVLEGKLDASVIVEPQFSVPKGYEWRILFEEPLVVLAQQQHAHKHPHELLSTQPLIRYDRSTWGGQLADRYLRKHGINTAERIEIDGLLAIASMISEGLGVSLLPDWAPDRVAQMGLARLALPGPSPVRRMGLFWPTASPHTQLAKAFLDVTLAVLHPGKNMPRNAIPVPNIDISPRSEFIRSDQ